MRQLPIFLNLAGQRVILIGDGAAAEAKARLVARAGAVIVGCDDSAARIAFVALDDADACAAAAAQLRARGLLVNVVDRPELCDFTTPAIVDRDPVLIAIGTGGASAGLAKALRQRLERLMPATLGRLAEALFAARPGLHARWPDAAGRRRAIDAALDEGGTLDPLLAHADGAVDRWLEAPADQRAAATVEIVLASDDPDDLTLRAARWLAAADRVLYAPGVPAAILARARADATIAPLPSEIFEPGIGELTVIIRMPPR